MNRIRWDEMRLQEEADEEESQGQGTSYGDGEEKPRRPIGFGRDHSLIILADR